MTSEIAWPGASSVTAAALSLTLLIATASPAQAAPSVFEEGCRLVASQEYNYYPTGGYDHVDVIAVKWELQRRGWPEDAATLGAQHGAGNASTLRPPVNRTGSHRV